MQSGTAQPQREHTMIKTAIHTETKNPVFLVNGDFSTIQIKSTLTKEEILAAFNSGMKNCSMGMVESNGKYYTSFWALESADNGKFIQASIELSHITKGNSKDVFIINTSKSPILKKCIDNGIFNPECLVHFWESLMKKPYYSFTQMNTK